MSEQLREALSALKDGEAEELELRRLLKHGDTQELDQCWRSMHRLTDAMSGGEALAFTQWDISDKVAAAIAQEPAHAVAETASVGEQPKAWYKPVAGFAVAASVAMAIVVGGQSFINSDAGVTPVVDTLATANNSGRVYPAQLAASGVGNVTVAATLNQQSIMPGTGLSKAVEQGDLTAEQRLHQYMLEHTEQSALNNGQGMINFARVVSYEAQ
ncbi:RseA family anti-sigma factor [Dasania sp. GY-MA-18]|uniref:RseA family anti-sigma factor n=1 Tax=Dasania phycosphaerae TaxID=2950436 RepID=A0A9J6RN47_9GAMM|nr:MULTISPECIES: RseA family anti-sigma factor [Dasania]MCR8923305.1 RseA family anti-sigma factor [Dasania sp. GY-MA-18]MCZ0865737.1 RseA family anti-sigma factor [Dasania phycosphaerae]MCZ0869462.1 RseA family anti-sigma factor [Dasania phycosphaerae]